MNDVISVIENNLSEKEISSFCDYLDSQKEYRDTGLGAFHTDDHSNW